ncbi:MAG: hypothetical protein FVQ80_16650 [Planctomycetes bacterium]|nr:hypothetical protein [Planctomycetota bacterium]
MGKIIQINCERCSQRLEINIGHQFHYCKKCGKFARFQINYFHQFVYFISVLLLMSMIFGLLGFDVSKNELLSYLYLIISVGITSLFSFVPIIKSKKLENEYLDSTSKKKEEVKSISGDNYSADIKNAFGFSLGDDFDMRLSLLKASDIKSFIPGGNSIKRKNGKNVELFIQADKEFNYVGVVELAEVGVKTFFTKPFQFHHLVNPKEKSPHFTQFYVSTTPITNYIYEIFAYRYKKHIDYNLYYAPHRDEDENDEDGPIVYKIKKSVMYGKYKELEEMLGILYGKYTLFETELKVSSIWKRHNGDIELTYKPLFDEFSFVIGHLLKLSYTDIALMKIFEREKKEIEEEIRLNKDKSKKDIIERLEKFDIKGL